MREIVEFGVLRSKAAVHHLRSCRHCREQLASFAHGWSQLGSRPDSDSDNRFSDQVLARIGSREGRRRLLRGTVYAAASLAAAAVALYYSGSTIYESALLPLWNIVISSAAALPGMAAVLWSKLVTIFSGPVILTVGAMVALIWFAMLDRVAGYLRVHLNRA
jgi:hypothetical protein